MLTQIASFEKREKSMRPKLILTAITAVLAVSLLGTATATAATEAGSKCAANTTGGGNTWVSLGNAPGSPISPTIPVTGVITRWTFNVGIPLPPVTFSTALKILRGTGTPKQFQVVADTGQVPISGGTNSFSARIPVQAGDYVGTFGRVPEGPITLVCSTSNPGDQSAILEGDVPLGSTGTAPAEPEAVQVPLVVFVEADADNDGYGDETQDLCPLSAAVQVACPPVVLSTATQVKKGSVTVIVTSSTAAPVTVKGVAPLGKGKKARLNGGVQNLVPSTLSKYRLFFTKGLKSKLKELPPKRSVKLNVTVSGTSITGAVTTKTLKLKLKGQAKT